MGKLIAIRNFSGQRGMVLRGDKIEVSEPYFSEYITTGLCIAYITEENPTFKNMIKKDSGQICDKGFAIETKEGTFFIDEITRTDKDLKSKKFKITKKK